jgi:hypothetical protein
LAIVTQIVSVRWLVGSYVEPNAAPYLGRMLAAWGRLELIDWARLKGLTRPQDPPLRAFELPGEPTWVAAGTRAHLSVFDYWNVPVAALLIVSIAAVAFSLGGPTLALVTGLIASLDPVTLLHASNRDDAVLGSALLWAVFAMVALKWRGWGYVPLFIAAGAAALTRMEPVLMIVPLLAFKPIRRSAIVAVAGVVVAIGAWGLRNYVVLNHFMIGSTHDGITLWESNGPFALRSLSLGQVDIVSMDRSAMAPIFARTQELDEVDADAFFRREAVGYMRAHPVDVIRTAVAKIGVSIASVHPNRPLTAPRNLAAMLDNAVLLALAIIGFPRFRRWPVVIMCLITLALLAIGPAGMRYWLTLRGACWVLAAAGILSISSRLTRRTLSSSAPAPP